VVGVVLSSPVIQSTLPTQTEQSEETTAMAESTDTDASPTPQSENRATQPVSESNHVVKVSEPNNDDAAKGPFLGVSSVPMGRSSRYDPTTVNTNSI